jgi:hypothetical protein
VGSRLGLPLHRRMSLEGEEDREEDSGRSREADRARRRREDGVNSPSSSSLYVLPLPHRPLFKSTEAMRASGRGWKE